MPNAVSRVLLMLTTTATGTPGYVARENAPGMNRLRPRPVRSAPDWDQIEGAKIASLRISPYMRVDGVAKLRYNTLVLFDLHLGSYVRQSSREFFMKLKSVVAAVALATVGLAANASDYTFVGNSLPTGVLFTETTTFAGSGSVAGPGLTSFNLYSVSLSPLGFPMSETLVETGTMLGNGWFLSNKIFGAGSYFASATGSGPFAGFYSTVPVAAVPEPETYAMMLAGLGVMGFVAARRKS